MGKLKTWQKVGIVTGLLGALTAGHFVTISCKRRPKQLEEVVQTEKISEEETKTSQELGLTNDYFQHNQDPEVKKALESLEKGISFYKNLSKKFGVPGGYDLAYSLDLTKRIGRQDEEVSETLATVIEPGTPTIGQAFLTAFKKTGELEFLEAAEEAGNALIKGQLKSGGWSIIEFDPEKKAKRDRYLECLELKRAYDQGRKVNYNPNKDNPALMSRASLKERITQVATDFMLDLAQLTREKRFEESAKRGLEFLIEAQFPVGAWPMTYPLEEIRMMSTGELVPLDEIVPNTYSYNDGGTASCIQTMLRAWQLTQDTKYLQSVLRGADFILKSQNPEGGWSLHYTYDTKPTYGRGNPHRKSGGIGTSVEPPSNSPEMTAEIVKTLTLLYLENGNQRYFEAAKKAVDWLKSISIKKDQWAVFYEFKTNLPLFHKVTETAHIFTHDIKDRPEDVFFSPTEQTPPVYLFSPEMHPASQTYKDISRTLALFDYLAQNGREEVLRKMREPSLSEIEKRLSELEPGVKEIIEKQGEDGRWLNNVHNGHLGIRNFNGWIYGEPTIRTNRYDYNYDHPMMFELVDGKQVETRISSGIFETNVRILSEYLGLKMKYDYMTRK